MNCKYILFVLLALCMQGCGKSRMHISEPKCEGLENPLGIDNTEPHFSWKLQTANAERQVSYEILVASRKDLLKPGRADLWDSGLVTGDASVMVPYGGKPLQSFNQVCQEGRIIESFRYFLYGTGEAALKDRRIFKYNLRDPVGQVVLHVDQGCSMLTKGIASCRIKDGLGCVLTLCQKLADPSGNVLPGQVGFIYDRIFHRVTCRELHAGFVKPDGVVRIIDSEPFAAFPILAADKLRSLFGGGISHKAVDDTELASGAVASGPQELIDDFCRNVGFTGIYSIYALLNLSSLLIGSRISRKYCDRRHEKSRGVVVLCFGCFLCFCFVRFI